MCIGKVQEIGPRDEVSVESKLESTRNEDRSRRKGFVISRGDIHNAVRGKFYFGKTRILIISRLPKTKVTDGMPEYHLNSAATLEL